jgi:hypothetical protein
MFHRNVNRDSGSEQSNRNRKVETSISHSRRDDHENEKKSIIMNKSHRSPDKSTRRY